MPEVPKPDETGRFISDMFGEPVDLHADLQQYLNEREGLGAVLQHPLVYSVPYAPMLNHDLNKRYVIKKAEVDEALAGKNWSSLIFLHERPYRTSILYRYAEDIMADDPEAYWKLLGNVWVDTENFWQNLEEWEELWERYWGEDEIASRSYCMAEDEQAALVNLPEEITIYRGISKPTQEDGMSWSLDRAKAEWFAKRYARADDSLEVLVGQVSKSDVLAHFLGRNEDEIVVFAENVLITDRIAISK